MYRLLKLRTLPSCSSHVVSLPIATCMLTRTCALCNHTFMPKAPRDAVIISHIQSMRLHSTHTKSLMQLLLKKKKRKVKKKYAELLEVTEDSSSQKKASISKLSPKHFSLLTNKPDIDLNELFQLKKLKPNSGDNLVPKSHYVDSLFIHPEMNSESIDPKMLSNTPPKFNFKQMKDAKKNIVRSVDCEESAVKEQMSNTKLLNRRREEIMNTYPLRVDDLSVSDDISHDLSIAEFDAEFYEKIMPDLSTSCDIVLSNDDCVRDGQDFHKIEVDDVEINYPKQNKRKGSAGNRKLGSYAERKETKAQADKEKMKELEMMSRSESLTHCLVAYMDICVSCGLLSKAMSTLHFYRSRKGPKICNIKPYDILLQGFAGKGYLSKVKDILKMIDEDKLSWSLQTYSSAFECVGRHPQSDTNLSLLQNWIYNLEKAGWTPNDMITKSTFLADQQEMVLKAIHYILPNFKAEFPSLDTCYSCKLLYELNKPKMRTPFNSPAGGAISRVDLMSSVREQLDIESRDHIKVKSIEKIQEYPESVEFYRQRLRETEAAWRAILNEAFKREMEALKARHKTFAAYNQINLYPFLRVLDPSLYVELIMKEIRRLAEGSETYSPSTSHLYRNLGSQVLARYEVEYKRSQGILNKIENLYEKYCDWYLDPNGPACNTREEWQMLVHENSEGPSVVVDKKEWPGMILYSIGKFLYGLLLRDIKIDVNILKPKYENQYLLPAFYTLFRCHGRINKEEIKPHPALARLYRNAALDDLVFDVNLVPMLSPPLPWTSASTGIGGYLITPANLVRLSYLAFDQKAQMDRVEQNQLYPSLDSLNQLGAVPWIVNETVLDLVIEVFNNGGSPRLDIPQPPSACPQPRPVSSTMSREERVKAYQERLTFSRRRAEMYSLWCDALYRLSLANHYRKRVFWLPHNMDFRGRVYPCPPHLNHLGSDMARSLLKFAKGQPLGPNGLDWLMIHLINLTGLKKNDPVEERLMYAQSILPYILNSAQYPLTGDMWWASKEEPWQVLATCIEIANALHSGNPETYVSHFPIHQDGSCNGLQHYAALGRDSAGALSVNLTPSTRPQDVYSCVAALVERERTKDAAAGVQIAQVLDGFVRRKVIKQTVMTTVYGVTRYGARLQIARQLKDIDDFPEEWVWHGSFYLVSKTFECLREMFTSTKEIQDWFTECARFISQHCGKNVEWVTPLGLPVVQPYIRFTRRPDYSSKSNKIHEHFVMDTYEKPNVMKQKNAFPPNFIHSLDSSHMMLTSLYCEREGITFVSVHDCYWTHPCTVDIMNKVCREQFVALHSQPILKDLSQYLYEKFGTMQSYGSNRLVSQILRRVPPTGDFDLENVLKSVYFFS